MIGTLLSVMFPNLARQFKEYRCQVLGHQPLEAELLGETWTFCDRCTDWKRGT